jgi:RHS repeat-associated protein
MTLSATCAFGDVFPSPSFHRGEQYDSDLGLYYLRARYYNPATGRFLSRDPFDGNARDPASLHKYLYGDSNPVYFGDPTGLMTMEFPLITGRISLNTVMGAIGFVGALDCLYEFNLTDFDSNVQAAMEGGSISRVGPCVWLFVNAQNALPKSSAPAQAVPGTRVAPWPPECNELRDAKNAAKDAADGKECTAGMHWKVLEKRYGLWLALANARQAYNATCWNGGDTGHQDAVDTSWENAQDCAKFLGME